MKIFILHNLIIVIVLFFNAMTFGSEARIDNSKDYCILNENKFFTATKGVEVFNYMKNELYEKIKLESSVQGDDRLFSVKKDGFEYEMDQKLFSTYVDFFRRDLVALNREPTYSEMQSMINYRLLEMTAYKIKHSKGFFSNFLGFQKFEQPSYVPVARVGRVLIPTNPYGPRQPEPPPMKSDIDISIFDNLPPDTDRKAWIKLWQDATGRKFDVDKDIEAFKIFREETKKNSKK